MRQSLKHPTHSLSARRSALQPQCRETLRHLPRLFLFPPKRTVMNIDELDRIDNEERYLEIRDELDELDDQSAEGEGEKMPLFFCAIGKWN